LNAFEYYLSIFIDSGKIRKQYINLLIQDGQFSRAATELESQLPMDKGNKEREATRRVLALCYRNVKRYREAALLYRELLRDNPKSIELLKALVYCLEKDKQYEIAIRLLESAKSFFPKDIDTALMLGIIYYRSKKLEKSLDIFRKVTCDFPSDYRAYRNISLIYANQHLTEISQQFLEKSLQLEKAIKTRRKRK
jgi:tetratricopeptide (TPR) repeat protein